MPDSAFKQGVELLVREIPNGRVMTYGQIALLLGQPRAARAVGWTAHWGDPAIPWQRVVNQHGRCAPGYPGGMPGHAAALAAENVTVNDEWCVDVATLRWEPPESAITQALSTITDGAQ